jgi:diguanylate cyclase (GGDEF)-like protein
MEKHKYITELLTLSTLDREYQKDIIAKVADQLRLSTFSFATAALLIVVVLWQYVPHGYMLGWLGIMGILMIHRAFLVQAMDRVTVETERYPSWYYALVVNVLLSAFAFGMSALFLLYLDGNDPAHTTLRVFLISVPIGIVSVTTSTLSPDPRILLGYLVLMLLPVTIVTFIDPYTHVALSVLAFVYMVFQGINIVRLYRIQREEYHHRKRLIQTQKELLDISLRDALTSLKNRHGLMHDLDELYHTKGLNGHIIIYYLDLDNFHYINNTYGHTVGDQVLIAVARRLQYSTQEHCTAYRIGGDEFQIIQLVKETDYNRALELAEKTAEKINALFDATFQIDTQPISIRCSIGIAIADVQEVDIDTLSHHADIAMYQAKRNNRSEPVFFTRRFEEENSRHLELMNEITNQLHYDQFDMHYQPIVSMDGNQLVGAEALMRWYRPNGDLVPPNIFIPLAIELHQIHNITWWIIQHVLEDMRAWVNEGLPLPPYVSINITPSQLAEKDFADRLLTLLERNDIAPKSIRLEITEIALVEDYDISQQTISYLRRKGILCMLDDFGTGYSSISYLNRFDLAALKIDKIFVQSMMNDPKDHLLIRHIIEIASELNYGIVAEGIETEEQRNALAELSTQLSYQGYLFSKPLDYQTFTEKYLRPTNNIDYHTKNPRTSGML